MPQLTDAQIAGYLRSGGFPPDQIGIGVAIALAESGGRTDALNTANRNGSWDAGLMQVNSIHGYSREWLYNPTNNVAASLRIYRAAGNRWTPWSTYNNGSYRRFLARGNAAAGNPAVASPAPRGSTQAPTPPTESPFANLTNPSTWQRVGLFLAGAIAVLIGVYRLTGFGEVIIKTGRHIAVVRGLR